MELEIRANLRQCFETHRGKTGDTWHLDEVFLKINGKTHSLWRAVDQYGNVLDILVQSRRDKKATKKCFHQLPKGLESVARVIITDTLASDADAKKEMMPGIEHRQHKGLNHRAENSHPLTRQRERTMRRFTSPGHAQRFLSAFGPISEHFRPRRHRLQTVESRATLQERFHVWKEITGVKRAAELPQRSSHLLAFFILSPFFSQKLFSSLGKLTITEVFTSH